MLLKPNVDTGRPSPILTASQDNEGREAFIRGNSTSPLDEIMTTIEAAEYLRLSKFTLEGMRVKGGGPRYAKLSKGRGRGAVRYRRADLDAWVAACLVESTSQVA